MINRRGLITGLIAFAAAPAIVRASSLMPVKPMAVFDDGYIFSIVHPSTWADLMREGVVTEFSSGVFGEYQGMTLYDAAKSCAQPKGCHLPLTEGD